jgi:hypothetical protein
MGHGMEKTYYPRREFVEKYNALYNRYVELGEKMENK